MPKHQPETSKHHIVCRSIGGGNHPDNIQILGNRTHANLHALLGNRLFHEQVEFLESIAHSALQRRFSKEIHEVIGDNQNDMYKPHCYRMQNGVAIPKRF